MKKIFIFIIALSVLFITSGDLLAQSALPATSVRTTDGKNVQLHLNQLHSDVAGATGEILTVKNNITTLEVYIDSVENNLLSVIAPAINLIQANLGTMEIRFDSIENNILSMIEPAMSVINSNLATHEIYLNSLSINLGTLELKLNNDILALANNIATHETKISSTENYLLKWLPTTTEAGYLYYDTTEAKVKWQMVTSGGTGVTDHTLLSNIGTKTHAQLESDITTLQNNATNEVLYSTSFATSNTYLKGVIKTSEEVLVSYYNQLNPHGLDMYFDTTQVSLSTGAVSLLSVCQLNSVEVMAAFCDSTTLGSGNLYVVRGIHANRSESKITWGTPKILDEAYSPYDIVIKRLSDSKFVILFAGGSATSYRVVAGNIVSGNIILGASVATGTTSTVRTVIGEFNETTACIYYCSGGLRALYGRPFFIDLNNAITFGTAVSCGTNWTGISILSYPLTSTQNIVIGSSGSGSTNFPVGRIANINAGVLTWTGTPTSLSSYATQAYTNEARYHTAIEKLPLFNNTFIIVFEDYSSEHAVIATIKVTPEGNVVKTSTNNELMPYSAKASYLRAPAIKSMSDGSVVLVFKNPSISSWLNFVITFDKEARPSTSACSYVDCIDGETYNANGLGNLIISNDVPIVITNKLNGIFGSQYVMNVDKYKYVIEPIICTDVPYYGKYIRPNSTITHSLWSLTPNTKVYTSPDVLYPISQDSPYYNITLSKYIGYAKSITEIYIDNASELFNTNAKYRNRIIPAYGTTYEWYVPFIIDDIYKYPVYFNGLLQNPITDYSIITYPITSGQYIKNPIGYTKITTIIPDTYYGNTVTVLKNERE